MITTKKWEDMQAAIGKKDFPSGEVLELLRLRSQLDWRGKRTVALEAAIFVEKLMRDYAHNIILTKLRRSKRYLDNIKRELNLFTILNIMLPMSLPKSDEKRLEKHIRAIDNLRKLRNDIMHGKIDESDIDEREVRASIESTLKILDFIDSKKKKAASSSN